MSTSDDGVDNDLRGTLRNFGLKVGIGRGGQVRSAHHRACGGLARSGRPGRTAACCPPGGRASGRCGADLSRHRRYPRPQIQVGWGGVRTDVLQGSIRVKETARVPDRTAAYEAAQSMQRARQGARARSGLRLVAA